MTSMPPSAPLLLLFIEIKCALLSEEIQFPRTKKLPLICCACFVKSNKFKAFSETFLKHFGPNIEYQLDPMTRTSRVNGKSRTQYVRNRGRSKEQREKYLKCMDQIIKQIKSDSHDIQLNIRTFNQWIIGNILGKETKNNYQTESNIKPDSYEVITQNEPKYSPQTQMVSNNTPYRPSPPILVPQTNINGMFFFLV